MSFLVPECDTMAVHLTRPPLMSDNQLGRHRQPSWLSLIKCYHIHRLIRMVPPESVELESPGR